MLGEDLVARAVRNRLFVPVFGTILGLSNLFGILVLPPQWIAGLDEVARGMLAATGFLLGYLNSWIVKQLLVLISRPKV